MSAPHQDGAPNHDGAIPTRRFSYASNRRFGAVSNRSASWCVFSLFVSASRRIRDLRRVNDAARRAGHDGTICFFN